MKLWGRRRLRAIALSILYQMDLLEEWNNREKITQNTLKMEKIDDPKEREFTENIVKTVCENRESIDRIISSYLKGWDIERLNVVERNILRIGVGELLFGMDIPYKVAINEAVELSKVFAAEGAASLINAVLDKVAREKGVKK